VGIAVRSGVLRVAGGGYCVTVLCAASGRVTGSG
jgi:hypothetical protein